MNSPSKVALVLIGLLLLLVGGFYWLNNFIYNEKQADEDVPIIASYFEESLVTLGIENAGQPIEGFDANLLMIAFPELLAEDFDGVKAAEGHYEIESGAIKFVPTNQQMMTSAAGAVTSEGYVTLLENLSLRLNMPVRDEKNVDEIIEYISGNEQSDQINIGLGEEGISPLGVTITVLEVIEDSRCPNPANCIQAGTVKVRTTLVSGLGTANQIFELNQSITTEAEEVVLVSVDPWPEVGQTIQEGDYIFHFEVSKR